MSNYRLSSAGFVVDILQYGFVLGGRGGLRVGRGRGSGGPVVGRNSGSRSGGRLDGSGLHSSASDDLLSVVTLLREDIEEETRAAHLLEWIE